MNIILIIKGLLLSFLIFATYPVFATHQHRFAEPYPASVYHQQLDIETALPINPAEKSKKNSLYAFFKRTIHKEYLILALTAALPALLLSGAVIIGVILPILWLWILGLSIFGFLMFYFLFFYLRSDRDPLDAIILLLPMIGGIAFGLSALIAGLITLLPVLWIAGAVSMLFGLLMIPPYQT